MLIKIRLARSSSKRRDLIGLRGLFKNHLFYFGFISVILFWGMYASCDALNANGLDNIHVVFFNSSYNNFAKASDGLFSSSATVIALETPDLKIIQDNTLSGISAPHVVSGRVLGDVFGSTQNQKTISNYMVQPGDTIQSIASDNKISVNTLLWANELTSSSVLKVGQNLNILPIDGVLHVIKSGDTISGISQIYKSQASDVISFNDLANQDDVYIGDILILPGGIMPKKSSPLVNNNVPLAGNFFIFPTQGRITQGLHFYNAIDVANKCGTPIYAAAAGVVERAVYNNSWNLGMGNYVTILHSNGIVTYYGHFQSVFVKPGDKVNTGDRIGLMGQTGNATGCHVHFQVVGAKNPLSAYYIGSTISYK